MWVLWGRTVDCGGWPRNGPPLAHPLGRQDPSHLRARHLDGGLPGFGKRVREKSEVRAQSAFFSPLAGVESPGTRPVRWACGLTPCARLKAELRAKELP